MGAAIQEDSAVTVTCADQYEIQLTGAEILAEGNVYLVTKENGEPLPEESCSFISVEQDLGSVSYTHLDVYKRQARRTGQYTSRLHFLRRTGR